MISRYNQKLTYAECGRKAYEFSKSMGAFILALTQANAGGGKPKTVRLSATHSSVR